jgi:hypothetical protein
VQWTAAALGVGLVLAMAAPRASGESSEATDSQHLARGDVKFAGQWVALPDLVAQSRAVRAENDAAGAKVKAAMARMVEISHALEQARDDYHKAQDDIGVDLGKNQTKMQKAQAHLAMPLPTKPSILPEPAEPMRSDYKDNTSYTAAHNVWLTEKERTQNDNLHHQDIYDKEMERYTDMQQRGKTALAEATVAIEDCKKRMEDARFVRKGKEKVLTDELAKLTADQAAAVKVSADLATKLKTMAEAIRTSPEAVRTSKGIVDWNGQFYTLADLQATLDKMTAEVAEARKQAEERAAKVGGTLPLEWRHPRQDDIEALRAVIEKAKAGPVKATPTQATPTKTN